MTHEDLEKRLAELDQHILALQIKVEVLQRFMDNFKHDLGNDAPQ